MTTMPPEVGDLIRRNVMQHIELGNPLTKETAALKSAVMLDNGLTSG